MGTRKSQEALGSSAGAMQKLALSSPSFVTAPMFLVAMKTERASRMESGQGSSPSASKVTTNISEVY